MKIVTLTLSPAYDLHCRCDTYQSERENLAHILSLDAGGKGINISRALGAVGTENDAIVLVGKENGDSFLTALAREGLRTLPFFVDGRIRENITLHAEGQKETRISFPGFHVGDGVLDAVESKIFSVIGEEDAIITLTGSLPEGIGKPEVKAMLARLKAHGAGIVVDSRSFDLFDLVEIAPYLIKPNEEEIVTYMKRPIETVEDAIAAAKELHGRGIESVMVSLGGRGAVLACKDGTFFAEAKSITPISTVGAGDSSIAGFLSALVQGKTPEDCLRYAVAFGSAACLTEGTAAPRKEDIDRLL